MTNPPPGSTPRPGRAPGVRQGGDEVVARPDALLAHAESVRSTVMGVDTSDYHTAMTRFANAPGNDLGDGGVYSIATTVEAAVVDVERRNLAGELFAVELLALDRSASDGVARVQMGRGAFARFLRGVASLPPVTLMRRAAMQLADRTLRLRADLVVATDPRAGVATRRAARDRIVATLAELVDEGVGDDPPAQAMVIDMLGPRWLADFAAMGARVEVAVGDDVAWVAASMQLLATWTAAAVAGHSPMQRQAFMARMPAELVAALATAADWGREGGAAAAEHVWDTPPAGRLGPVVPASFLANGWPIPTHNRGWAALVLATNPAAAHLTLARRDDILNGLVTNVEHPAAADAVIDGLVRHPTLLAHHGDHTAIAASATAFARLMDAVPAIGSRTLSADGVTALRAVAAMHLDLMANGNQSAANAFLSGASGTHAWVVNEFLAAELADNPDAVRAIARESTPARTRQLIATLADDDVVATAALNVVGEVLSTTLDAARMGALGVQSLADLVEGMAVDIDVAAMQALATSVVGMLDDMDLPARTQWLSMLGIANDHAGAMALVLASANDVPGDWLPVLLASEATPAMTPRSAAIVVGLDEVTGDWRRWSHDVYVDLLEAPLPIDHPNAFDPSQRPVTQGSLVLRDAVAGTFATSPDDQAVMARFLPVDRAAQALATAGTSPGLRSAVSSYLLDNIEGLDAITTTMDWNTRASGTTLISLLAMARGEGTEEAIVGRATLRAIEDATSQAGQDVGGALHEAGQQVGILQQASRSPTIRVDAAELGRIVVVEGVQAANNTVLAPMVAAIEVTLEVVDAVHTSQPDFTDGMIRANQDFLDAAPLLTTGHEHQEEFLTALGYQRDSAGQWTPPAADSFDQEAIRRRHPGMRRLIDAVDHFAEGLRAGRALDAGLGSG